MAEENNQQNLQSWIAGDETAAAAIYRLRRSKPLLRLPPPLHRFPLRAGNVVEISGPSPSAKSHVLIEVAVYCIMSEELGGLGKSVAYFDLDCRFDILRLAHVLNSRIAEVLGRIDNPCQGPKQSSLKLDVLESEGLFASCMRRFLYIRCYSSVEFLAALKTIHCHPIKESKLFGVSMQFLMIDSIGAFYWIDRANQPVLTGENNRKKLSFQSLSETIVSEIRKIIKLQPALVLATKAAIFGPATFQTDPQRSFNREPAEMLSFREYMPSVWQSFVTHRIHLQLTDCCKEDAVATLGEVYMSKWFQPSMHYVDKFVLGDNGISML